MSKFNVEKPKSENILIKVSDKLLNENKKLDSKNIKKFEICQNDSFEIPLSDFLKFFQSQKDNSLFLKHHTPINPYPNYPNFINSYPQQSYYYNYPYY